MVGYLPKDIGCLASVQQRKARWKGQDAMVCHVSREGILGREAGLYHGLRCHHGTQVEGVEGLVRQIPEVMAREGGVTAPHTRLQDLADSVILFDEERWAIPRVSRAKGEAVGRGFPDSW